ncbi:uncharacterized protein LOC133910319 [Phragmites australis]|uniref:uncharacterized protein LOC133910319 n=1 Tax=Phragmites australis TaxID=29695 RepID=UPI002D79CAE2|nr:uncharacterized protein LOC133910319 [Phragmites australis]
MEQDKRAALDLSKGEEQEQGGEVVGAQGLVRGAASPEQDDVLPADNASHVDAGSESDKKEDPEEPLPEESEGSTKNEDHVMPQKPSATRVGYRSLRARPTPPSPIRRLPMRRRKQYGPTQSIAVGDEASEQKEDDTVDKSKSDDGKKGTDEKDAAAPAPSSCQLPSRRRSRKQRRPLHFIPEEAEAIARSEDSRSNIVFWNRFLTYLTRVPPEQRPEWVRSITGDGVRGQGPRGVDSTRTASGSGPEELEETARILAVLGASLVLSVLSLVLFYIANQRTEHGPSDEHQKKFAVSKFAVRIASPEQEDVLPTDNAGHGDAGSESDEEEDLEEPLPEESEGSAKNEDHVVPKNPSATRVAYRSLRARASDAAILQSLPANPKQGGVWHDSLVFHGSRIVGAGGRLGDGQCRCHDSAGSESDEDLEEPLQEESGEVAALGNEVPNNPSATRVGKHIDPCARA